MRRIIMVALDGSEKDGRAIASAVAVSRLSKSDLHFVRVVGQDVVGADRPDGGAALAHLAESLPPHFEAVVTSAGPHAHDIAASLLEYAIARDVLLLVLATRAPGARSRAIAGSVADHVMRESPRPVILVPPGAAFLAGKEPTITRVLVPLDDSSLSFRSLEFIIELPGARELEYVLVEVVEEEHARATAELRLAQTAVWLRSRGAKEVEVLVLHSPDAAGAIISVVRRALVDAILMSTRGAGGLGRLILGSVAEQVVRQSELPVMLLTPRVLAPQ
jgi:nucleotide-binding universal stress UspA family protein